MIRKRTASAALLAVAISGAACLAACEGCRSQPANTPTTDADGGASASGTPSIRLYLLSTVAGALEPCGCTKDQLGGFDHLAAFVASQEKEAPSKMVIGAGPLLYMEPEPKPDAAKQIQWKAEAIASASKALGLFAWSPGYNDWVYGKADLDHCASLSGAKILAANLSGDVPAQASVLVGGPPDLKVGVVGVADPKGRNGKLPDGVTEAAAADAFKRGIADLEKQGARVIVGVAAIPRGEALRLADSFPDLNVLVVGKPFSAGDANDKPTPPVLVGSTLVVESANHLQTVGVVDLFVRGADAKGAGRVTFADAGGVATADEVLSLASRIRDLEARINSWERDKTAKPEDIAARKADLEKLRADKAKLEVPTAAPAGSFFRYKTVEVREGLGSEPKVKEAMLAYYKGVNELNKKLYADRKPPEPEKGESSYVGVEACTTCHDDARKVWDKTPHANAYATLAKEFKEYNLDCVSCHVTGYAKPGGSTVTFVEKLTNVQCEQCHGPGSKHAKTRKKEDVAIPKPAPESCVSQCHHSPHVEGFDAKAKMKLVLGPGHGEK